VLNCLNGNTHRLTLLDLRSDTGNPNSIGFIRAYAERRLRRATSLALGPNAFISLRLISRLNGKQPGWVFSHSGRTLCQFLSSLASTSLQEGHTKMSSSERNPSFGIVRHCFMVSIAVALGHFQTGAQFLVAASV